MKDRLLEFLNREELSASRLAETIDVQASSISHILTERNKPGFDFLIKLFTAYPKLNPKWLMLGIGQMYLDDPARKDVNDIHFTDSKKIIQQECQSGRQVEKVILFFSDNTFETYKKE